MILNQAQAKAIYAAMRAVDQFDPKIDFRLARPGTLFVQIKRYSDGKIEIFYCNSNGERVGSPFERYDKLNNFGLEYKL